MGSEIVLYASIALASMLLYIMFKLRDQSQGEGQQLNGLLQIILLGFVLGLFVVIAKTAVDGSAVCVWNVNETVSGYGPSANETLYSYNYTCANPSEGTASTLYLASLWLARVIGLYILFFILISVFGWFRDLVARRGNNK